MSDHGPVLHSRRILTIASSSYDYQCDGRWPRPPVVPYLRLRGYWLDRAGFSAGQRVVVSVSSGCITITPAI